VRSRTERESNLLLPEGRGGKGRRCFEHIKVVNGGSSARSAPQEKKKKLPRPPRGRKKSEEFPATSSIIGEKGKGI